MQGATGATGPQGVQGAAGSAGSDGSTGPQGNQGVQGAAGSAGGGATGVDYNDNVLVRFGNNNDFGINHNGTNTVLSNYVGDLIIGTYGVEYSGDDIIIESADDFEVRLNTGINIGSGTTAIYATGGGSVALNYNGSTKFETKSDGIDVTGEVQCDSLDVDGAADITGTVTLHGDLDLQDSDVIKIGTGDDLQIQHTGASSRINNFTGPLYITNHADDQSIILTNDSGSGGTATYIRCDGSNGSVEINYYGSNRLVTSNAGVIVTGIATATKFVKSGGTSSQYLMADGSVSTGGSAGPQGNQGVQGAAGGTGPQGAQGNSGQSITGPTGPQGNQGVQGAAGSAGSDGSDGSTGPQGNQGVQGAAGATGSQGVQGATGTAAGGNTGVDYNDNIKVRFGSGESKDLEIYHDGSNSIINEIGTGELKLQRGGVDRMTLASDGVDFAFDVSISDDYALNIGDDNDLTIYETNSDVAINYDGTGVLFMRTGGDWKVDKNGSKRLYAHSGGAVDLYYADNKKLETSNDGVIVTGIATATKFVKSGGTSSQYLMADGSVSTAGSGGISNVVEDTTPQLGGDLDLNGNGITGSGTVNLIGIVTTTGTVDLTGTVNVTGIVSATSFVKTGGTSSQYLMADGTVSTGGGTGPQGVQGAAGGTGPQGATGATGPQGAAGSGGGGGSLYYLHVDGTTTQNLSTSAVTLALNSTIATSDSSDFTVATDGQITVINAGTYFIEYSATGDQTSGNDRIIVSAQLEVNGTVVTGSESDVYSRNTAKGDFSAVGSSLVVLSANDVVRVRAFSDSNTLIATVDNSISGLSMFSLGGAGAQGNQGVQGAAGGPTGPQGNQGVQGAAGSTGPQGNQGVQGAGGSTGGTGPTGNQGVQGAAGGTGPQGVQGATGPQGAAGSGGGGSGVSTGKAIAMAMIFG